MDRLAEFFDLNLKSLDLLQWGRIRFEYIEISRRVAVRQITASQPTFTPPSGMQSPTLSALLRPDYIRATALAVFSPLRRSGPEDDCDHDEDDDHQRDGDDHDVADVVAGDALPDPILIVLGDNRLSSDIICSLPCAKPMAELRRHRSARRPGGIIIATSRAKRRSFSWVIGAKNHSPAEVDVRLRTNQCDLEPARRDGRALGMPRLVWPSTPEMRKAIKATMKTILAAEKAVRRRLQNPERPR